MYKNRQYIYGPANINEIGLPAELENMDAALEWRRNGKAYFFKGDKYWRFSPVENIIDSGYPKSIAAAWRGVPESGIDDAVQWKNGKTYFFKGENYYAIDDYKIRVQEGYPRKVATYWMGCGSNGDVQIAPDRSAAYGILPNVVLFVVALGLAWLL